MASSEWLGFYSAAEVSRLARVPLRTIYYWGRHGIIVPSLQTEDGEWGYSYADLTIIRLLRAIREKHLNFRSASLALRHLYERLGPPNAGWADARIVIQGRHVYAYVEDEWEVTEATQHGQRVQAMLLPEVLNEIADEIADLTDSDSVVVPRQFRTFITINPAVRGGAPVVKGTRIPTAVLAALHRAGATAAQIARMYADVKSVTRKVVDAVLAYEKYLDAEAASPRAATA